MMEMVTELKLAPPGRGQAMIAYDEDGRRYLAARSAAWNSETGSLRTLEALRAADAFIQPSFPELKTT